MFLRFDFIFNIVFFFNKTKRKKVLFKKKLNMNSLTPMNKFELKKVLFIYFLIIVNLFLFFHEKRSHIIFTAKIKIKLKI